MQKAFLGCCWLFFGSRVIIIVLGGFKVLNNCRTVQPSTLSVTVASPQQMPGEKREERQHHAMHPWPP